MIEFASVNKLDMDTQRRICNFISKKHPHGRIMIDEEVAVPSTATRAVDAVARTHVRMMFASWLQEFLAELPPSLRTVVVRQLYSDVVSQRSWHLVALVLARQVVFLLSDHDLLSDFPESSTHLAQVSTVPIFKHLEGETQSEICAALLPIMYTAGDQILREGSKSDAMY